MVLNKVLPNTKLERSWVELLEITLNNDPKRGVHIKKSNFVSQSSGRSFLSLIMYILIVPPQLIYPIPVFLHSSIAYQFHTLKHFIKQKKLQCKLLKVQFLT